MARKNAPFDHSTGFTHIIETDPRPEGAVTNILYRESIQARSGHPLPNGIRAITGAARFQNRAREQAALAMEREWDFF